MVFTQQASYFLVCLAMLLGFTNHLHTIIFYELSYIDIPLELLVSISVDRTDPPGFIPADSTEYRAASGPQDVTCTATGGSGSISYQWSSTCNGCVFSSSTVAMILRAAVHSGDIGTHTCTATDTAGSTGSTGVVFNIVGE